jgi:hypothetical protein
MRKAKTIKEDFIKPEINKTQTRFQTVKDEKRNVKCALDDILKREMLVAEKETRSPRFHSRAMYDEVLQDLHSNLIDDS